MDATEIIVTLVPHRYRAIRRWEILPEGLRLKETSKLAVDSYGDVYIYQRVAPPVVVFDSEGRYARCFERGRSLTPTASSSLPTDRVCLVDRGGQQ